MFPIVNLLCIYALVSVRMTSRSQHPPPPPPLPTHQSWLASVILTQSVFWTCNVEVSMYTFLRFLPSYWIPAWVASYLSLMTSPSPLSKCSSGLNWVNSFQVPVKRCSLFSKRYKNIMKIDTWWTCQVSVSASEVTPTQISLGNKEKLRMA